MIHKSNESMILLTYKEKILLMIRDYDLIARLKKTWCMIGGKKESNESFDKAITRKIKEEMNIEVHNVKLLLISPSLNRDIHFYHGRLTDNDVNRIERSDGQELQFFNLKELDKLQLAASASLFFTKHRSKIEQLIQN